MAYCGRCRTSNPLNAKFCTECGARLRDAPDESNQKPTVPWLSTSAEVERRQLTILFCDLVGVSTLASALDPEDLHEIIKATTLAPVRSSSSIQALSRNIWVTASWSISAIHTPARTMPSSADLLHRKSWAEPGHKRKSGSPGTSVG